MQFVSPRVIRGNRGDLISRYGILSALHRRGIDNLVVFCHREEHIRPLPYRIVPYGSLYNLIPTQEGLSALRQAKAVLWTAGLDIQDDSSLVKLLHLYLVFLSYRSLGLNIYSVAQGAGPLETWWGHFLTRQILNLVDGFLVRDPGSYAMLKKLNSHTQLIQGYDGIFLGNYDLSLVSTREQDIIKHQEDYIRGRPLIGINLRQWFHFSSGVLPYQLARNRYLVRSQEKMSNIIEAVVELISALRRCANARIILISTYEPNVESWEDDLPWLQQVKARFEDDDQVAVANQPYSLLGFCLLLSKLDLMIGVRLHSTLTAIRFGVPALNLSYTLKGRDIFHQLGFGDWVVDLESFMRSPIELVDKAIHILGDTSARDSVSQVTEATIQANERALDELLILHGRRSHRSM